VATFWKIGSQFNGWVDGNMGYLLSLSHTRYSLVYFFLVLYVSSCVAFPVFKDVSTLVFFAFVFCLGF
jgi:hypothetical protein